MDGLPIAPDQDMADRPPVPSAQCPVPGARWPTVTAGRLERRGGHKAETKGRARRGGLEQVNHPARPACLSDNSARRRAALVQ